MTGTIHTLLLDRDGVINHDSSDYIKHPDEWHPITGSMEAIRLVSTNGVQLGVATNQNGIALGLYDHATLNAIHDKMHRMAAATGGRITAVRYCPHSPEAHCTCRKPMPGMLLELLETLNADPTTTAMVGDRYSDIEAARAAGVQPILLLTGYGQHTVHTHQQQLADTLVFPDLAAAALAIYRSNTPCVA